MTRLTDLSIRRRWLTLAVWLVLTAGLIALAQSSPGPTSDDYTMPDAPSSAATELLQRHGLSDDEGHGGQGVLEGRTLLPGVPTPPVTSSILQPPVPLEAGVPESGEAAPDLAPPLGIVGTEISDEAFEAERERREAWRRVLAAQRVEPVFVDLAAPDAADAATALDAALHRRAAP